MQPDSEHEHLLAYALHSWHHESIQFYQINMPGPNSDIKLPFLTSLPWVRALVFTEVVLLPILKQVKSGLSSAPHAFGSTEWQICMYRMHIMTFPLETKKKKKNPPKPQTQKINDIQA